MSGRPYDQEVRSVFGVTLAGILYAGFGMVPGLHISAAHPTAMTVVTARARTASVNALTMSEIQSINAGVVRGHAVQKPKPLPVPTPVPVPVPTPLPTPSPIPPPPPTPPPAPTPPPPLVFQREQLPSGNIVEYVVVDPHRYDLVAAAAQGSPNRCSSAGIGSGCLESIAGMESDSGGIAAVGGNVNNANSPLGLVVVNHVQVSAADPHTTILCVGDRAADGTLPISFGKSGSAAACRFALAGEQLVVGGSMGIEGISDGPDFTAFWSSVKPTSSLERQFAGVRGDGQVIIGITTGSGDGMRAGMSLPGTAKWMIAHGVVTGIAFDGGHEAGLYQGGNDLVPQEQGVPKTRTALLVRPLP